MSRFKRVLIAATVSILMAVLSVSILSGSKEPDNIAEYDSGYETVLPELTREQIVFKTYAEYISKAFDSLKTVGAAFTIVHNGDIVMSESLGVRRKDLNDPVDEHTIFRLASVSKGFAGALASLLEDEKYFSLDDRVVDHYPGFMLKDSASTYGLTIRHLLSHTTGLVPHAFDNLVEEGADLEDIVERLDEVDIFGPPGELYGYQNVLFSLIDPISEEATGKSYAELLKCEIFDPLEMNDAFAGSIDTGLYSNIAYPHMRGKGGYVTVGLNKGYYNVLPAAGVNASISDMGRWLQALLGYDARKFPHEISEQLSTPVIYTPLKWQYTKSWEPFKDRYYSLGWRIYDYKGRRIIYHGGYVRGYRAEIAFCPAENVGMAFLQNSPNGLASKSVPVFFDMFFEAEEESQ